MAEAPSNNPQGPICRFFLNSTCRNGSKCRFSHRLPTSPAEDAMCKFYLRGNCRFGDKCWNRHGPPAVIPRAPPTSNREPSLSAAEEDSIPRLCESFASGQECDPACALMHGYACPECGEARLHPLDGAQRRTHMEQCARDRKEARTAERKSSDKVCGVCLEVVCEKVEVCMRKFGVLESCDHVFCFDCIMQWRKVKEAQEDLDAVSLSCPLCRTPSAFVAPCCAWPCSTQEKRRLIADRRAALRARPCTAFSRWGHCPRGALCLHHHRTSRKARDLSPPPSFLPRPELDLMESLLLLDLMDEVYFSSDSEFDSEDNFLLQDMDFEILGSALDFW